MPTGTRAADLTVFRPSTGVVVHADVVVGLRLVDAAAVGPQRGRAGPGGLRRRSPRRPRGLPARQRAVVPELLRRGFLDHAHGAMGPARVTCRCRRTTTATAAWTSRCSGRRTASGTCAPRAATTRSSPPINGACPATCRCRPTTTATAAPISRCSGPSSGQWYLKLSSGAFGGTIVRQWGLSSDTPIAADFDGDGRSEIAVFRPGGGLWYVMDRAERRHAGAASVGPVGRRAARRRLRRRRGRGPGRLPPVDGHVVPAALDQRRAADPVGPPGRRAADQNRTTGSVARSYPIRRSSPSRERAPRESVFEGPGDEVPRMIPDYNDVLPRLRHSP